MDIIVTTSINLSNQESVGMNCHPCFITGDLLFKTSIGNIPHRGKRKIGFISIRFTMRKRKGGA